MYGISQLISEPTGITADSQTLVDYVVANQMNVSASVHGCPKIWDHSVLGVNLYCGEKISESFSLFRNISNESLNVIKSELMMVDCDLDSSDIATIYDNLLTN
ncbi:hypothetical protein HHI36_013366 [Cryptolaemus montrouzieri]|uniref:Uncharacterized protein n=1 Tax=Cryptolaemus montrouzieri TaxID=559131 RepID=A0ABD2NH34_9CUCU